MPSDLREKLAQVASRLAASQQRLRSIERSATSLRRELEELRTVAERAAEPGAMPTADDWDPRVPTRPLALALEPAAAAARPFDDEAENVATDLTDEAVLEEPAEE